jgi:hypothetical protein
LADPSAERAALECLLALPEDHDAPELDLSGLPLGDAGAAAVCMRLAARPPVAGLDRLALAGCRLGVGSATGLAALLGDSQRRLGQLDLRRNGLADVGALVLADALKKRLKSAGPGGERGQLKLLDLSANAIGPDGAAVLTASAGVAGPGGSRLERLNLRHNLLGDVGAARVAEALIGGGPAQLDLSACGIGSAGAQVLDKYATLSCYHAEISSACYYADICSDLCLIRAIVMFIYAHDYAFDF